MLSLFRAVPVYANTQGRASVGHIVDNLIPKFSPSQWDLLALSRLAMRYEVTVSHQASSP